MEKRNICRIKKKSVLIIATLCMLVMVSCATLTGPLPPKPVIKTVNEPIAFQEAIPLLANNLMNYVNIDLYPYHIEAENINIMIVPFKNGNSAEIPKVSRTIENIIIEIGKQKFKGFNVERLTSKNLSRADYIINGNIRLDPFCIRDTTHSESPEPEKEILNETQQKTDIKESASLNLPESEKEVSNEAQEIQEKNDIGYNHSVIVQDSIEKYYHITASIRNLREIKIVGNTEVWITNKDIDYNPIALYKESPLYLRCEEMHKLKLPEKKPDKPQNEMDYLRTLEIQALLTEAETVYEGGNYEAALSLFDKASQYEDGQLLRTYIGLYLANNNLGNADETEKALGKIIAISVEKYNTLTIKFLFEVNSVEFSGEEEIKERYDAWLRQLGKYFHDTDHCIEIVGHCSHTGTEELNNSLSLQRAQAIQQRLLSYFPEVMERSKVIGMGFRKNIIGTGTDDEHDALDRRVEILIVDCEKDEEENKASAMN